MIGFVMRLNAHPRIRSSNLHTCVASLVAKVQENEPDIVFVVAHMQKYNKHHVVVARWDVTTLTTRSTAMVRLAHQMC